MLCLHVSELNQAFTTIHHITVNKCK